MAENSLILLDNATKMLAEVKSIDDVKYLMDIAASAKYYAQKHNLGKEAVSYARSIEVSAEIKLGEFLREMEKNKGAKGSVVTGRDCQPVTILDDTPTLKEIGVSKNLSAEAQILANLPSEEQEKVKTGQISKKAIKKKAATTKKQSEKTKAQYIISAEMQRFGIESTTSQMGMGLSCG